MKKKSVTLITFIKRNVFFEPILLLDLQSRPSKLRVNFAACWRPRPAMFLVAGGLMSSYVRVVPQASSTVGYVASSTGALFIESQA